MNSVNSNESQVQGNLDKDLESIKAIFFNCSEAWRHNTTRGISVRLPKPFSIYGKDIRRAEKLGFSLDFIDIQWETSTVLVFRLRKKEESL